MEFYIGLLLYILTFIGGFWLDTPAYINNKELRRVYVVWLYVFLCFGYMTGSDWRNYEIEFYDWNRAFGRDYGYVYTMNALHYLIDDFWILYDAFRCLYLWTVILVLKQMTRYWMSSVSFLIPISLLALTVDSPLRFMMALTLLNFAILYIHKSKYQYAAIFCIIAATFHSSVILIIPFLLFLKTEVFVKTNNWILILIYVFIVLFTSNLDKIINIQNQVGLLFDDFGLNTYSSYQAGSGVNALTLGLVLQSIFFLFVLFTKTIVAQNTSNGGLITNMAILSFFVRRFVIAIPTGHRIGWLFTLFVAIYYANLFHIKYINVIRKNPIIVKNFLISNVTLFYIIFIFYFGISMTKTIVNHFVYSPYSNSIPYIIMGHKPYMERYTYNLDAYKERTGKHYILNSDKKK